MKKRILTTVAALLTIAFISCKKNTTDRVMSENLEIITRSEMKIVDLPVMTFSETNYDFGTIKEGDIVEHEFTFTNTGNAPLLIVSAKGNCGCTVSKWPKEPIPPGDEASLLVSFNSNGKPNLQNKQVTITANTKKGKEILKIKAMVTPKTKNATK